MNLTKFVVELIMSLVRHALVAAGTLGIVVPPDLEMQIAGVVAFVVGLAWILVDKFLLSRGKK